MKTYICMNNQLVGMLSCLAAAVAGTEGGNTANNTPTLNFRKNLELQSRAGRKENILYVNRRSSTSYVNFIEIFPYKPSEID
jgi:hypothetical protein